MAIMVSIAQFKIRDRVFTEFDPDLQLALQAVHADGPRPRCLCRDPGVEMYVAHHGKYIIKRLPNGGHLHNPNCGSYGLAPDDSGLGQANEAVIEHSPDKIEVRVDFAMSEVDGHAVEREAGAGSLVLGATTHKLSIRGLLHWLWEGAAFNVWHPRMRDKRPWYVIRKYLLAEAERIEMKGFRLSDRIYIPEPFSEEKRDEIVATRRDWFDRLRQSGESGKRAKFGFIVGELKDLVDAPGGNKAVVIKNLWEMSFQLPGKLSGQFEKRFRAELDAALLMKAPVRLIVAFTVAPRSDGFNIHTVTLMMTTQTWIPVDFHHERFLADRLTEQERHFIKPLRFDAPGTTAFANFNLTDTGDLPTALNIVGGTEDKKAEAAKIGWLGAQSEPGWVWRVGTTSAPPALPAVGQKYRGQADPSVPRQKNDTTADETLDNDLAESTSTPVKAHVLRGQPADATGAG